MAKMTKCKTCGADMASSAKVCPACGAKNSKPIYKRVWFWIVVVIVVVIIASAAGGGKTSGESTQQSATAQTESVSTPKPEKYEIVGDLTTSSDAFSYSISGVIKNNSGKDLTYLQVEFNLYDANGNQLGTALANIDNLAKDGTWKFKAVGIDTDNAVASYKLAEITGY